jgi:rhamnulokinase
MEKNVYVAIDLGAESGRIIAGDVESMEVIHRFPNTPVRIGDSLFWNALGIFSEIKKGLKEAFARYGNRVVSLGVDTWGVDYGLLDLHGELLGNPYHYRDSRTDHVPEQVFEKVPREQVYRTTGIQIMQINTLYQLYSFSRNHPEMFQAARHLLTTPNLFNYWLSGALKNEYSITTTTQLYNPVKREWAYDLINSLGLKEDLFGEIVMPGAVVGTLLPSIAQELGAPEGVRVVAVGCHDTASAVAAVPALRGDDAPRYAYLSSGTWSLLGIESPQPIITEASSKYNFTNEGAADGGIRFLKNIMGLWIVQECKRSWDESGKAYSYAELTELAAEHGPADFTIDVSDDRFLKPGLIDESMPERVEAYCRETGQTAPSDVGGMVRGVLESLAHTYVETLGSIKEITGNSVEVLHIIGGGSQNDLLSQLTADAAGIPVYAGPVEATAIGNMLVQAVTAGDIESLDAGRKRVRDAYSIKEFTPR